MRWLTIPIDDGSAQTRDGRAECGGKGSRGLFQQRPGLGVAHCPGDRGGEMVPCGGQCGEGLPDLFFIGTTITSHAAIRVT